MGKQIMQSSHSVATRRTAVSVAISLLLSNVLASPAWSASTAAAENSAANAPAIHLSVNAPLTTGTDGAFSASLISSGINSFNAVSDFATDTRLALMNPLYDPLVKTKLQTMTCLDKILAIKFITLGTFSFSAMAAWIEGFLMSLVCSLVDTAWDSAMGKLTSMTSINMGAAGSVSLISGSSNGVTVGPVYQPGNFGTSPYVSQAIGAGMQGGTPSGTTSSTYSGFGSSIVESASAGWEQTKNFFK